MVLIAGIDFATARADRTWLAVAEAADGRLAVHRLTKVEHDKLFAEPGLVVAAIDVPLGWPRRFREAVWAHRADKPARLAAPFPERLTDREVRRRLKPLVPLTVAADRIGRCVFEAAPLLARAADAGLQVNPTRSTGRRAVIETYPKGTLRALTGEAFLGIRGYRRDPALRTRVLDEVLRPLLALTPQQRADAVAVADALDALLALLTAYAFHLGLVMAPRPEQRRQAAAEGWIYLPSEGAFALLKAAALPARGQPP